MPRPPRWGLLTEAERAEARRRYEAGDSITAICRRFGTRYSTVYGWGRMQGWRRPPKELAKTTSVRDREAEIRQRYEAGESARSIALSLGVTKNTIIGLAHRRGWRGASPKRPAKPVLTLLDRMDALEARGNAVFTAYPRGYGAVPIPTPEAKRKPAAARDWAHR